MAILRSNRALKPGFAIRDNDVTNGAPERIGGSSGAVDLFSAHARRRAPRSAVPGPAGAAAVRGPAGNTAVRGPVYGGTTVYRGGSYGGAYYGGGVAAGVAAGAAVGVAAGAAAAASSYYYPPPYYCTPGYNCPPPSYSQPY